MRTRKRYLGDGVYAEWSEQEQQIWLTTENGIFTTNEIAIDGQVLGSFEKWVKELKESFK